MRSSGAKFDGVALAALVGGAMWRPALMAVFSSVASASDGTKLEGLVDLALGSGEVASAQ